MPAYTAIAEVGDAMKRLLQEGLDQVFDAANKVEVTLDSPKRIEDDTRTKSRLLSVFLYKVLEDADLKNRPFTASNSEIKPAPLSLNLCYMLTPYGADEINMARILGRAMQILYDNTVLQDAILQGSLEGALEQINISLNPLGQDLIVQIWQALEASMRVSAFYLVTPVLIDSTRVTPAVRVRERNLE